MEVCDPRVGVSYVTVILISLQVCQQIERGMWRRGSKGGSGQFPDILGRSGGSYNYVEGKVSQYPRVSVYVYGNINCSR